VWEFHYQFQMTQSGSRKEFSGRRPLQKPPEKEFQFQKNWGNSEKVERKKSGWGLR
jgi:hypothetical protein